MRGNVVGLDDRSIWLLELAHQSKCARTVEVIDRRWDAAVGMGAHGIAQIRNKLLTVQPVSCMFEIPTLQ